MEGLAASRRKFVKDEMASSVFEGSEREEESAVRL